MSNTFLTTAKQYTEINTAIAAYLKRKGFTKAYEAFLSEAEDVQIENVDETGQLLERKFITNARLQVKVNLLEKQLLDLQGEATNEAPTRDKRKSDEWLPRPPELVTLSGHRSSVTIVVFHPVYNILVSGGDDACIRIWDPLTNRCERTLTGHTMSVNDLAFNSKGTLLASCSSDMKTKIWDFGKTYSCLKTFAGHEHSISSVAFLADNKVLTGSRDNSIKLWEIDEETNKCTHNFQGHTAWVRMIRVNPNAKYLASCSTDRLVKIWDMESKNLVVDLRGHDHVIECIAWASDSTAAAMNVPVINSNDVNCVIEGNPLVVASGSRDRNINIWHINIGSLLFTLQGHDNWVRGVVFHPVGKYLISVSDDKTLRTWDLQAKTIKKVITPHNQFVNSIAFNKTEPYVATGASDATVKVWECR